MKLQGNLQITPQNKIVMVSTIHNKRTCYFKIHCAGFLQSQQFQVKNIHKVNAIIADFTPDPCSFHKSCLSSSFQLFHTKSYLFQHKI